ncbi:MAG: hypothetical protein CVU87_07450 [Firmicutes bacterium HGW-Firmicutes-12]|jgi:hypothetical protein|nr:MAG: hypothetical protein CVU87_07450 [Firmicutes bacterium HGW-Firmicutes-12]
MKHKENSIILPEKLRGRSIHEKVIPTVCNLKNMLDKLIEVCGDISQLKQWEKRSYQAYYIEGIKSDVLKASHEERVKIIRNHILSLDPHELGASCTDIYLVAVVAENYGAGKDIFFQYVKEKEITSESGSAQAIWQVGKGDGVYLGILNEDGSVKDWDFIARWVKSS